MWINYNGPMFDGGSGSTMHLTAGVGTLPDHANLATSAVSDGIWFGASGDGGSTLAVGDVDAYAATTLFNDDAGVYAAGDRHCQWWHQKNNPPILCSLGKYSSARDATGKLPKPGGNKRLWESGRFLARRRHHQSDQRSYLGH
jgi:hypothetical protein